MLYNDLKSEYRLEEEVVQQIITEALDVEIEFITESIPCAMLGMNSNLMIQYLQYVADRLLVQLGYSKKWNSENPFDFMENIGVEGKTNFFEERVSAYSMSGVGDSAEDKQFDLDVRIFKIDFYYCKNYYFKNGVFIYMKKLNWENTDTTLL